MYTLTKTFKFEAAHKLPHHDGKCARLHGHSWVGRVVIKGENLQAKGPKSGMLVDFSDIGRVVEDLVEHFLDHHYLNETLGLANPTSEEIARWVYGKLYPHFRRVTQGDPHLVAVEIDETCTCSARYDQ